MAISAYYLFSFDGHEYYYRRAYELFRSARKLTRQQHHRRRKFRREDCRLTPTIRQRSEVSHGSERTVDISAIRELWRNFDSAATMKGRIGAILTSRKKFTEEFNREARALEVRIDSARIILWCVPPIDSSVLPMTYAVSRH